MDHLPSSPSSRWFNRPGYIPLKEYVDDIESARAAGPWVLPLHTGDRIQLFLLKTVLQFSWFADRLFVLHPHVWSPAYHILVSYLRRHGWLTDIREKDVGPGPFFAYSIPKGNLSGQGIAIDRATAFSKVLGEMIEREVSGKGDQNSHRVCATPKRMAEHGRMWYPPSHHRFLPVQQERFAPLRSGQEDVFEWVLGKNLITREKTALPRQITSWFSHGHLSKEPVLFDPTSNGCAGYFTRRGAVLRGLLEVVNRDGFLVHWLTQIPPRVIRRETLPEELGELARSLERQ